MRQIPLKTTLPSFLFPFPVCIWEDTEIEADELEKDFEALTEQRCAKMMTTKLCKYIPVFGTFSVCTVLIFFK